MQKIPYGRQFIDKYDKRNVESSLSGDLITTGPYVKKFEKKLKDYLESNYSFVCSSGTAALHLAMLSINLKPKDTILMPAVNFIASYNIAKIMKLKVYLVDVDELTGQITPNKVLECIKNNKIKNIKALLVMFHGGFPEYSKKFYDLKKKYKFKIIEDACHAFGAKYIFKDKLIKIGSCKHADISTFSLHPVKTITSGEGGVITTNNFKIAENIKLFRNHGIVRNKKKYWNYDIIKSGFNYRLSDINCALGLSQLKKINFFLRSRKKIYKIYYKELKNFNENLQLPRYSKNTYSTFHLFLIHISFDKLKKTKDHFLKYLNSKNIFGQFHYKPIYKFKVYTGKKLFLEGAEKYSRNTLSIPIFVSLSATNQKKIIKVIKEYF